MNKEIDLNHVKIEESSKSKRREVRAKKALGEEEAAKKIWEDDKNRPDHIRKRIDNYLNSLLECTSDLYPKEKKTLEEISYYSDERVRDELAKYEGVNPEKRKEEFKPLEFFKKRFSEKEKTTDSRERVYKTLGIYRWFFLLDRTHKEDLETLFRVDGMGKTSLDKVVNEVRQESSLKKR